MIASIIIPVAPYHEHNAREAVLSAEKQTVAVEVLTVFDAERRGAGWARNRGLEQVKTPFVVMLDADDTLHPRFVEETFARWQQSPGMVYVYTDWQVNGSREWWFHPEGKSILNHGLGHTNTTLLPTEAMRAIGGYDESLKTLEDEDLYIRLELIGLSGLRVPRGLLNYRRRFGRSLVNADTAEEHAREQQIIETQTLFRKRYGASYMCDRCPTPQQQQAQAAQQREYGDVLVAANYTPRMTTGKVTGRKYQKAGHGDRFYMNREDAEVEPHMYTIIADPSRISPDVEGLQQLLQDS